MMRGCTDQSSTAQRYKFKGTCKCSLSCQTRCKSSHHTTNLRRRELLHKGQRSFVCATCDKAFNQASHLCQFVCKICNKRFNQGSTLRRHGLLHTGKRSFSCKTCNKRFNQALHLHRHELLRTGQRPFVCKTWNRSLLSSINFT